MTERRAPSYADRMAAIERRLERLERGRSGDLYDVAGNLILGDDAVAGQGLGRPYLPLVFTPTSATDVTTSSAAFTDMLVNVAHYKQHPRLLVQVYVGRTVADTTGEVQLTDATGGPDVVLAGPVATGANAWVTLGPVALPGAHLSVRLLRIQARRVAGTGLVTVRLNPTAWALES